VRWVRLAFLGLPIACGRLGFEGQPADDGNVAIDSAIGAAIDAASCTAPVTRDVTAAPIANDPLSGLSHPSSFTVSADQLVVHDNVTGLEWQRTMRS
jgi:hypothetical protein